MYLGIIRKIIPKSFSFITIYLVLAFCKPELQNSYTIFPASLLARNLLKKIYVNESFVYKKRIHESRFAKNNLLCGRNVPSG